MNTLSNNIGIRFYIDKNVNLEIKLACKEFAKWLKISMSFNTVIKVYISEEYKVITKKHIRASGIFGTPTYKYPYIKLATGDFKKMKQKYGEYSAIMSIIDTFAHEIIHYKQWIENTPFKEKQADKEGRKLVEAFSEYKDGFLYLKNKAISLISKGDKQYNIENYIGAIKYYKKVIKLYPKFNLVYSSMGDALSYSKRHEEALCYYNKGIEIDTEDYNLFNGKALTFDELERYEEAIICYDDAIRLNPDDSTMYSNKGYPLVQTGRLIEALDCYNKAISLDSKDEDAHIFKAEVLEKLLKYDESLACYEKAILINCNNAISYNGKGHVLYLLDKYKEAIEYFNISTNIDSQYVEPYYNAAKSYIALNDTENCMINLKKSIKLDEEYKIFAKEEGFFNSISNLKGYSNLSMTTPSVKTPPQAKNPVYIKVTSPMC